MPEPLEPEIVTDESTTDETEAEYAEPTICQTGFNQSVVVTPVKCSECETEFYIKPDTIDDEGIFCQGCGVQFTQYDDEF